MAKLPTPFDAEAHWIRDLLHRGKRSEALARLQHAVADGRAGEDTKALAAYLAAAGKGRQPFGLTHLWIDIGQDNDEMRSSGVAYSERMSTLGGRYMLADPQIEAAIAKFEAGMRVIRAELDDD